MLEDPVTSYLTHDNGSLAFRVDIGATRLDAYRVSGGARAPDISTPYDEVFVGKSPVDAISRPGGGHGPGFDGNSILYRGPREAELEYVHIGRDVLHFWTRAPVVEYVSPVSSSDVPYPYAVDSAGNTYLVIEAVTLLSGASWRAEYDNPYIYYHDAGMIAADRGGVPPGAPAEPRAGGVPLRASAEPRAGDIEAWWVGGKLSTMRYIPWAEAAFDRLAMRARRESTDPRMFVQKVGRAERELLTKESYAQLMRDFGTARGFEPTRGWLLEGWMHATDTN